MLQTPGRYPADACGKFDPEWQQGRPGNEIQGKQGALAFPGTKYIGNEEQEGLPAMQQRRHWQ